MNRSKMAVVIGAASLLVSLPFGVYAAAPPDPAAAKLKLRQLHQARRPHIQHDASLASCSAYTNIVNQVNAKHTACMNPDAPPQGSPIFKFNAMSNMALGQYCGTLPFDQCINKVNAEQTAYCDNAVAPMKAQAEKAKGECSQAQKECTNAKAAHDQKLKAHAELEQKVAKAQQDLNSLQTQLANAHNDLAKANIEVNRQCKIQLPHPAPPRPITIGLPPGFQPVQLPGQAPVQQPVKRQ